MSIPLGGFMATDIKADLEMFEPEPVDIPMLPAPGRTLDAFRSYYGGRVVGRTSPGTFMHDWGGHIISPGLRPFEYQAYGKSFHIKPKPVTGRLTKPKVKRLIKRSKQARKAARRKK